MDENINYTKMKKDFNNIFKSSEPYAMHKINISNKLLIFFTDKVGLYRFDKIQYKALIKTLKKLKKDSFWVSEVEGIISTKNEDNSSKYYCPKHYLFNTSVSHKLYLHETRDMIMENAIYGDDWGIITAEDIGVLGGDKSFIDTYKKYYKRWEKDLEDFEKYIDDCHKEGKNFKWFDNVINCLTEKRIE
jgi:hypothetical protein